MGIQLKYKEEFSEGLKRLITEECQTALRYLKNADNEESRHAAVHETRKAFKKVRACLRLVRDHIDYYKEENVWFRDMARKISEVRDATANLEVLDVLEEQYDSQLYENAFDDLRKSLKDHRESLANSAFRQDDRLSEIQAEVENKIAKIAGWPMDIQSFDDIRPSIKRTYKRGYKGLKRARETDKMEDFHDWRKRAKYLRYHIDIMNRLWPRVFTVLEDELHDITDFTGTMHDLHNLQNIIPELKNAFADTEEKILFDAIAEKHQGFMRRHALLKGRKFYSESPSDFCDRLEIYWKTHQKEIRNEALPAAPKLKRS